MTEVVVLERGCDRAIFDLDDGARLTELMLGGHSLLVDRGDRDPMWWGAFIMAPWTSLLRGGAFTLDARTYRLADVDPESSWHGVVWNRPWRASTSNLASIPLESPWPLGGAATLDATLYESALSVRLLLRAGDVSMPGAIGWHPWFRRSLGTGGNVEVSVPEDARVQQRDFDDRPTGGWIAPTRRWNDCLHCAGPIDLVYPQVGRLRVNYSSEFVTLFTTDQHGVCVEPVTSAAERMDRHLGPGQELTLDIQLTWSASC